jgi:hypothetical protein
LTIIALPKVPTKLEDLFNSPSGHSPASAIFGETIVDPSGLGRWRGVTFRGSSDRFSLSVITAYRTCGGNIRTSPIGSTFSREFNHFCSQGHLSPNPRQLFLKHLQETILDLQAHGNTIVLMIDANSVYNTETLFAEFLASCGLNDLHSSHPPPTTYIGAKARRINYIFGCDRIATSCSRAGALAYTEGPQSDHRGLFVDLDIQELRKCITPQKMSPQSDRSLHTKNPELVSLYINHMKEYYATHNMFSRMKNIADQQNKIPREQLLNLIIKWDNDQNRAMSFAERKLTIPPKKCEWSPHLRNAAVIRLY